MVALFGKATTKKRRAIAAEKKTEGAYITLAEGQWIGVLVF